MLIFLDLKKAFDSVDHLKLLRKLESTAIFGKELVWFRSYLSNRPHLCHVQSSIDVESVDYGVVQGSNVEPIFFLIYKNNISKLNIFGKLFLFVDGTLSFV